MEAKAGLTVSTHLGPSLLSDRLRFCHQYLSGPVRRARGLMPGDQGLITVRYSEF